MTTEESLKFFESLVGSNIEVARLSTKAIVDTLTDEIVYHLSQIANEARLRKPGWLGIDNWRDIPTSRQDFYRLSFEDIVFWIEFCHSTLQKQPATEYV